MKLVTWCFGAMQIFLAIDPAAIRAQSVLADAEVDSAQRPAEVGIADIIVTASRRAENAQQAAFSIQALSGDDLIRANVRRPEDLNAIAPGLSIGTAAGIPQPYIRGVGSFGANAFAENAVAFNIDGVYVSQGWASRGTFFDLERVEVLKGPQGTLYGRNATGGAINIITARAKLDATQGFVEAQGGNYDMIQGVAALNLPLGEKVALRASGQIVDRDGYLSDGYDDEEIRSARLQLLWQPAPALSLRVTGQYQDIGGQGPGVVLRPQIDGEKFRGASDPAVTAIYRAQPGIGSLLAPPAVDGFYGAKVYGLNAELGWDVGFANLTILPAYRDAKQRDRNYGPGFRVDEDIHDQQSSVEVRLDNSGGQLKWVLGGYFFDEKIGNRDGNLLQIALQGPSSVVVSDLDLNTRSYAGFGQATYSVTNLFRVTGGIRYTYERKALAGQQFNFSLPNVVEPTCAAGVTLDPASVTPPLFCRRDIPLVGRLTYKSTTFKAGVEYDVAERSMAYVNVSTGFKSGGFIQAPPPNTFKPEKLTAFETGIKNRFFDNRLQVNLEAFYWKYRDHQESFTGPTSIPGLFTLRTENAGQAKSYGADVDIVFRPTSQDDLNLKVQYNKTKYDSFTYQAFGVPLTGCRLGPAVGGGQAIDCAGKPLMRAALWSGTAGYSHIFDLGGGGEIRASGDMQFSSRYYISTDFLANGRQGAYALGNLDLTYTSASRRWSASAFVRNIGNKLIYTRGSRQGLLTAANPLAARGGVFIGSVLAPRTVGMRARFNF